VDLRKFRELQLKIFLDARALKVLVDIYMTLLLELGPDLVD
jgi:hypothetical protein